MRGRQCPACQAQYYRECWTNFVQGNGERWWHPKGPHGYKCMECGHYWPRENRSDIRWTLSKSITMTFALLRIVLAARYFASGQAPAVAYGMVEGIACVFSVIGLRRHADESWKGRLVPLLYLTPLALQPFSAHPFIPAGNVVLALAALQMTVRLYMWRENNVGVPRFDHLLTKGPYAVVRHPLAAIEIMTVIAFAARYVSTWNIVAASVAVASIYCTALIEERFIRKVCMSYDTYAKRVLGRIIPRWKRTGKAGPG